MAIDLDIHRKYPAVSQEWNQDVLPQIRLHLQESGLKVVVLDEDISGTQNIHNLPIITRKTIAAFARELTSDASGFYVLMNARDLPVRDALALYHRVMLNLHAAREQTGQDFILISRANTAARTHFPLDVNAALDALPDAFDGVVLVPTFAEQESYTIDNTYYSHYHGSASMQDMRYWVNLHTGGRIRSDDVRSISLETVRIGGPDAVRDQLLTLSGGAMLVTNAVTRRDVDVITLGALMAQAQGKRFLFRGAPTLAAAMNGVEPHRLLTPAQLAYGKSVGGLIVVGARTRRSTEQLLTLLTRDMMTGIEVRVESLLHDESQDAEVARCSDILNAALKQGDAVLYTSRRLVGTTDPVHDWVVMQRVNTGLVTILNAVYNPPRYLVAKGSITATEIATRSLNVQRATVAGQLIPGVPVWTVGGSQEMSYIIVPGSVDEPDTLVRLAEMLR